MEKSIIPVYLVFLADLRSSIINSHTLLGILVPYKRSLEILCNLCGKNADFDLVAGHL